MELFKSNRFWALVAIAVFYSLFSLGVIPQEVLNTALVILGGHIGIRTVDRLGEKIGTKDTK